MEWEKRLAKKVVSGILPEMVNKTWWIFLSGASIQTERSRRSIIRRELEHKGHIAGKVIDIYYPEEIFEGLWLPPIKLDLLSLETLLANSVHSVVIVLEGAGAIAELGAFAMHKQLCNKLIVVVNRKYWTKKSFIMQGPIRYLREHTRSKVLSYDFTSRRIEHLIKQLQHAIKEVAQQAKVDVSVFNPIVAQYFVMVMMYLLDNVKLVTLCDFLEDIVHRPRIVPGLRNTHVIIQSGINLLQRQKAIEFVEETGSRLSCESGKIFKGSEMRLSREGVERLTAIIRCTLGTMKPLDTMRLWVLTARRRRLK